jgi:hypothetical protein
VGKIILQFTWKCKGKEAEEKKTVLRRIKGEGALFLSCKDMYRYRDENTMVQKTHRSEDNGRTVDPETDPLRYSHPAFEKGKLGEDREHL